MNIIQLSADSRNVQQGQDRANFRLAGQCLLCAHLRITFKRMIANVQMSLL
jgi:hypothetical protein